MSFRFEIEARDGKARAGRMFTPHGEVETPVFMPVGTVATVKGVPQDVLEELGVQILLNNTYHLYLRPGVDAIRRLGGVQKFMAWERPILTDSGGFQVFSLSDLRKVTEEGVAFRSHLDGSAHFFSPESAMAAQIGLGADIIMAFDECTEHPAEYARTKDSMEMTLRWAARSKNYFEQHKQEVPWFAGGLKSAKNAHMGANGAAEAAPLQGAMSSQRRGEGPTSMNAANAADNSRSLDSSLRSSLGMTRQSEGQTQALFGIVQGGMFADLRRESAQRTVELDFPGYAIGGLSVGEPRPMTYEMVEAAIQFLPEDKPRYLMGVGTPEEIVHYAAQGVDMMDCVLPTRAARHGLLFTSEGRITIKNARYTSDEGPLDPNCGCKVCARYSRAYLRHLYASNELLAQVLNTVHNLAYYLDTMRRVRQAIRAGQLGSSLPASRTGAGR
ncbi:MAG TPA: tRNA guanosine(34) transglycosylase Tgt [Terriglobales bacterium]|nr:tRNA guanosine(34) transglycosylase Tgt [Terriglobales bacterium]